MSLTFDFEQRESEHFGRLIAVDRSVDGTANRRALYTDGFQTGYTTEDFDVHEDSTRIWVYVYIPICSYFRDVTASYNARLSIVEIQYSVDSGSNWVSLGHTGSSLCGNFHGPSSQFFTGAFPITSVNAGTIRFRYKYGASKSSLVTYESVVVNNTNLWPEFTGNWGSGSAQITSDHYAQFVCFQYRSNDITATSFSSKTRKRCDIPKGIDVAVGQEISTTAFTTYGKAESINIDFSAISRPTKTSDCFLDICIPLGWVGADPSGTGAPGYQAFNVQVSTNGGSSWQSLSTTGYVGQFIGDAGNTSWSQTDSSKYHRFLAWIPAATMGDYADTLTVRIVTKYPASMTGPATDCFYFQPSHTGTYKATCNYVFVHNKPTGSETFRHENVCYGVEKKKHVYHYSTETSTTSASWATMYTFPPAGDIAIGANSDVEIDLYVASRVVSSVTTTGQLSANIQIEYSQDGGSSWADEGNSSYICAQENQCDTRHPISKKFLFTGIVAGNCRFRLNSRKHVSNGGDGTVYLPATLGINASWPTGTPAGTAGDDAVERFFFTATVTEISQ